ncbi:MAG: LytTR family DNA-binding domain-containing protein [Parvularculaceae bacterium]
MQALQGLKSTLEERLGEGRAMDVGILAAAVALLCFLGPFGTREDLGPAALVAYWSLSISAGYLGGRFHKRVLLPALLRRGARRIAPYVRIAAITVCASACVLALEALLREPVPVRYAGLIVAPVLVISLAVAGVFQLRAGQAAGSSGPDPRFEAFRRQWPSGLRQERLLALSAEDHYVRVTTIGGDALVSARFSDAVEAVASLPGTQVHRSWWVAEGAPSRLDRSGGRWTLKVQDLDVPVSRRYRPEARAQGWDRLGR